MWTHVSTAVISLLLSKDKSFPGSHDDAESFLNFKNGDEMSDYLNQFLCMFLYSYFE